MMQGGDRARLAHGTHHAHHQKPNVSSANANPSIVHRRVPVPPLLRLSSLVNLSSAPAGLAMSSGGVSSMGLGIPADAESPVDVRALASVHTPSTPVSNSNGSGKLQLPELSQNEIKKAQNRKSAKRFREAQKRRWQLLNRELETQKRLVEELRRAQHHTQNHNTHNSATRSLTAATGTTGNTGAKMSIGTLTTSTEIEVDTEASLYAQLLCSSINGGSGAYVGELGALHRCVLMDRTGTIKGLRRGNVGCPVANSNNKAHPNSYPNSHPNGHGGNANDIVGENLFKHISHFDTPNVRNALVTAVDIVAIGYVRNGQRFNAVVKPVPNCDDVLLAEFLPFNVPSQSQSQQQQQQHQHHPVQVQVQHHHLQQRANNVAPVPHHLGALDALAPRNINRNLNNRL